MPFKFFNYWTLEPKGYKAVLSKDGEGDGYHWKEKVNMLWTVSCYLAVDWPVSLPSLCVSKRRELITWLTKRCGETSTAVELASFQPLINTPSNSTRENSFDVASPSFECERWRCEPDKCFQSICLSVIKCLPRVSKDWLTDALSGWQNREPSNVEPSTSFSVLRQCDDKRHQWASRQCAFSSTTPLLV